MDLLIFLLFLHSLFSHFLTSLTSLTSSFFHLHFHLIFQGSPNHFVISLIQALTKPPTQSFDGLDFGQKVSSLVPISTTSSDIIRGTPIRGGSKIGTHQNGRKPGHSSSKMYPRLSKGPGWPSQGQVATLKLRNPSC